MKFDSIFAIEVPERKENLFMPTFPLKSNSYTRNKKKRVHNEVLSKTKPLLSQDQLKVLVEKIELKERVSMPPIIKPNIKKNAVTLKTYKFKVSLPLSSNQSPVPISPVYLSKLFTKKNKQRLSEPYKFMLTRANFNYLNTRIMENNSSAHSIQELPGLQPKYYKNFSPDLRQKDYSGYLYQTSSSLIGKDYINRNKIKT
jgi:hypothetical protein